MISNSELKKKLKNIKLIVSDVDGTLTDDNNQIGELTKKLTVKVNAVSETAKAKIEAAGGTVEVI